MGDLSQEIDLLISAALAEDLAGGDATTDALIPPTVGAEARIVAKAEGVLAGVEVALAVMKRVDADLDTRIHLRDGAPLKSGDVIASVTGSASSLLKAERTALNFLTKLSGIATETNRYVQAVADKGTRILDTRKTTPGFRFLEKYAVLVGGGCNHRQNLSDAVLVKDNHIQVLREQGLSLKDIVGKVIQNAPRDLEIEVEVENLDEVREALEAGAEALLLDNMELEEMTEAVSLARGKARTEASGGVNLDNVRAVAGTGVGMISIGALTHSTKALDISLDLVSLHEMEPGGKHQRPAETGLQGSTEI